MKYLIVGRTGAGKDYFASLFEQYGLKLVKSYATRPKRFEEEDTHIFISQEEAKTITDKIATTVINGYEYFATATQVNESDIYVIDPRGVYELIKNMPDTKFQIIYVSAKSDAKRKEMAINRSSNSKENAVYDKRAADEDEQFTEFEKIIYELNHIPFSEISSPFTLELAKHISCIHEIENNYDEKTARKTVEDLAKNKNKEK